MDAFSFKNNTLFLIVKLKNVVLQIQLYFLLQKASTVAEKVSHFSPFSWTPHLNVWGNRGEGD